MPSDELVAATKSSEKGYSKAKSKKDGTHKFPSSKKAVGVETGYSEIKEKKDSKTTESKSTVSTVFQPLSSLMKAALAVLAPADKNSVPDEEKVTEIINEAEALPNDQGRSATEETELKNEKESEVLSRLENAIHEKKVTKATNEKEDAPQLEKAIKTDKCQSAKEEITTKQKETEAQFSFAHAIKKDTKKTALDQQKYSPTTMELMESKKKSNIWGKKYVKEVKGVTSDKDLSEKYAKIECLEDRAYAILVDLGMVEEHPDPDSPDYDDSEYN
jgi:hypothetical protein